MVLEDLLGMYLQCVPGSQMLSFNLSFTPLALGKLKILEQAVKVEMRHILVLGGLFSTLHLSFLFLYRICLCIRQSSKVIDSRGFRAELKTNSGISLELEDWTEFSLVKALILF